MNRLALIFTLLLCIPTEATALNFSTDMDKLTKVAIENDLEIEDWQVTIKENIDRNKLNDLMNKVKKTHFITIKENESTTKYLIEKLEDKAGISETYTIIIPHAENHSAELTAVVQGSSWDRQAMDDYQINQLSIISHYFTEKAREFSCLTAINHGIIKDVGFFEKVKQQLGLKYVSTQFDLLEQSIHKKVFYGYTNQWKEKITIDDKPLNMQMIIESTKNGKEKVIIGTPILINEY